MKKLFLFFAMLATLAATSQPDSSRLPLTLKMKVKHYLFISKLLSDQASIKDYKLKDSLNKAIGSGTLLDSQSTVVLRPVVYLRFMQALMNQQSGIMYSYMNEIITSTSGQGWTGLPAQLNAKISANNERAAATWLKAQVTNALDLFTVVYSEYMATGKAFAQLPVDDN